MAPVKATNDGRSEYALTVQRKAREAAESIRERSMVNSATWARPLATAPSAVSTMAILLKTSGSDVAAGIKVHSRDVRDDMGVKINELPHTLLQANLEWCSNRGRNAFSDARSTMNYINKIAIKMIEDRGKLENILRSINGIEDDEDEDEDDTLEDDIKDVRDSTAKCLEKIQTLTNSFQYWYRVIECLKENVIACTGETKNEANQNDELRQKKAAEKEKLAKTDESTSETIKSLQLQLKDAQKRVDEAAAHMRELESVMPVITELSPEEEQLLAEKAIPMEERKKGLFGKLKEKLAGESNEEYKARIEHQRDVEVRRAELIKQKKEQRESEKREAQRVLAAARAHEKALSNQVTRLIADVGRNREKLASAKANLDTAESQFKRLSEEKLQLVDILAILEESSRQLGDLRMQVQELVTFFQDILADVDVAVSEEVQKEFLALIEKRLMMYDQDGHFMGVKEKRVKMVKARVRDSAVKIQGSFCAIRDITAVYVVVSDRYITPAIEKMRTLADARDDEWHAKSGEFTSWCRQSMVDIENLTKTTDEDLVPRMTERLQHLQLAIAPA